MAKIPAPPNPARDKRIADMDLVLRSWGLDEHQAKELAHNFEAICDGMLGDELACIEMALEALDWRATHPDTYGVGYEHLDRARCAILLTRVLLS